MDLLEDLKMSLLNFSFTMIFLTQKMLVLLKHHLNYLKDCIFECLFNKYNVIKIEYLEILIIFLSIKMETIITLVVRVSNFCSNNYIEYQSTGDRNKTLSVEECINKIRPNNSKNFN